MPEYMPKDARNYSIANQFTAFFSEETSAGVFAAYLPVGNVVDSSFSPEIEELAHLTSFAGINSKDLEVIIAAGGNFDLVLDELVGHNLRWLFGSSTRATGAMATIPREEQFAFTGSPGTITVNGGAAIDSDIGLYAQDFTAYADPADYTVALGTGVYTRDAGGSIPISGTVKALYNITETAARYPIMDNLNIEGKLKIVNLAPEVGPSKMIDLFRVRARLEGEVGMAKDDWNTGTLQCEMLEDANGDFGNIWVW